MQIVIVFLFRECAGQIVRSPNGACRPLGPEQADFRPLRSSGQVPAAIKARAVSGSLLSWRHTFDTQQIDELFRLCVWPTCVA